MTKEITAHQVFGKDLVTVIGYEIRGENLVVKLPACWCERVSCICDLMADGSKREYWQIRAAKCVGCHGWHDDRVAFLITKLRLADRRKVQPDRAKRYPQYRRFAPCDWPVRSPEEMVKLRQPWMAKWCEDNSVNPYAPQAEIRDSGIAARTLPWGEEPEGWMG